MKAHRTDGVSFAFGVIFLAIAAWWLVAQLLDLAMPAVGWVVAAALILIGLLGLLGALRAGRNGSAPPPPPADPAYAAAEPASGQPYTAAEPASGQPYAATDEERDAPVTGPPVQDPSDGQR